MNVAEIVTQRILESMQKDKVVPWHKPWTCLAFRNAVSKKAYRGVNVLMLSIFGNDVWYMTPKQIKEHGGNIKKGTHTVPIVFWHVYPEEKDSGGNVTKKAHWILRYYNVLSLKDTEGVKIKLPELKKLDFTPNEIAEKLIAASGAKVMHGGNSACVTKRGDEVVILMPNKDQFSTTEEYYATLFHELTHWVHYKDASATEWNTFGSEPYSKEELTAEVGANFLLSFCSIDASNTYNNSVAYLNNWIEKLGKEPKWIVTASSAANRRFDSLVAKAFPEMANNGQADSEPHNGEISNAEASQPASDLVAA